jgi:hypothetical protein
MPESLWTEARPFVAAKESPAAPPLEHSTAFSPAAQLQAAYASPSVWQFLRQSSWPVPHSPGHCETPEGVELSQAWPSLDQE